MSWFGDLVDNVKALFSGEKKVFVENVNKMCIRDRSAPDPEAF